MYFTLCNEVDRYGKKEAGRRRREPANILTHFYNKINKHKWKAAAPHGRLPHRKHKLKSRPGASLVFHCRHSSFNPSEAPPWDSRPVSGTGVVHHHLLHRPRSVPTALGPAPLATHWFSGAHLEIWFGLHIKGWTTSDFVKLTFMWKSSRSWLVADEQLMNK